MRDGKDSDHPDSANYCYSAWSSPMQRLIAGQSVVPIGEQVLMHRRWMGVLATPHRHARLETALSS
jgi:hypothetical protein